MFDRPDLGDQAVLVCLDFGEADYEDGVSECLELVKGAGVSVTGVIRGKRQRPDAALFAGKGKVEVSRFKGLGEMLPAQLKETTMDPSKRTLLRVVLLPDDREGTSDSVERLMGTKAEARFAFISDKAEFASEDLLDV